MQVLSPTVPIPKGRDQSELGGLAKASNADPNPDRRHAAYTVVQASDVAEDEVIPDILSSRLISKSPISSETQAALLALLSEPQAVSGVRSRAFDDLVRDAAPGALDAAPGSANKADTTAKIKDHGATADVTDTDVAMAEADDVLNEAAATATMSDETEFESYSEIRENLDTLPGDAPATDVEPS